MNGWDCDTICDKTAIDKLYGKREDPFSGYSTTSYPLQFHPGFTVKREEDMRNHDPLLRKWIRLLNCQPILRISANISRCAHLLLNYWQDKYGQSIGRCDIPD